jgi:hypothetical protein
MRTTSGESATAEQQSHLPFQPRLSSAAKPHCQSRSERRFEAAGAWVPSGASLSVAMCVLLRGGRGTSRGTRRAASATSSRSYQHSKSHGSALPTVDFESVDAPKCTVFSSNA